MTTDTMIQERAATPDNGFAIDEQTGTAFALRKESGIDSIAAIISVVYMLLTMAFFFWLLFDIWVGQFSLANLLRYPNTQPLASPTFRLIAYTFIGGALGGTVNGIRSFLVWHAERYSFGERFLWKYITAPWLGGALALFTFTLIQSGVAILGGTPGTASASSVLATFGIGVLAGYGSHKVFKWLDAQVTRIFQVQPITIIVPALTGKNQKDAEGILKAAGLYLGKVQKEDQDDPSLVDKVIRQTPTPHSTVDSGASVDIIVGGLKTADAENGNRQQPAV
jgi:hypothetical protein